MGSPKIPGFLRVLILLMTFSTGLFGGEGSTVVLGTYIETESNNEPYAFGNLVIVPGLKFRITGNARPLYFQYVFENRDRHYDGTSSKYEDNEIRNRFHIGYPFDLHRLRFNPEYELRVRYFIGFTPEEKAIYENRFHLDFLLATDSSWSFYLKYMPTLILDVNDSREDSGNSALYEDYYHEAEIGTGVSLGDRDSLRLGIYSELGVNSIIRSADGTVNQGESFMKYEFQARITYSHIFRNGLAVAPFARVGLVRKFLYEEADGQVISKDFRRDRFGFTFTSSLARILKPFMEVYYQHSEMGGQEDQHRIMWKVGLDFSL